jgi:hypothetical protein
MADVTDITNSPAYTHLDALVAAGDLRDAQASLFKSKYAKLHDVVLRTYDNEKNLLRRAKQLNQELLAEKMKLDKATSRAQEDSDAIAALRDELAKGGAEMGAREERETTLQLEVDALNKQKLDLERDAAAKEKLQAELLQPQIEALERVTVETADELAAQQATLLRLQTERKELHERIAESRQAKLEAEVEKNQLNAGYVKVRSEPDKLKKQADVVGSTAQALEADVDKLSQQAQLLEQVGRNTSAGVATRGWGAHRARMREEGGRCVRAGTSGGAERRRERRTRHCGPRERQGRCSGESAGLPPCLQQAGARERAGWAAFEPPAVPLYSSSSPESCVRGRGQHRLCLASGQGRVSHSGYAPSRTSRSSALTPRAPLFSAPPSSCDASLPRWTRGTCASALPRPCARMPASPALVPRSLPRAGGGAAGQAAQGAR